MQQQQSFALNRIKEVLWVLAVAFAVVGTARMFTGLGASSYMSDNIPWGLWKIFNSAPGRVRRFIRPGPNCPAARSPG